MILNLFIYLLDPRLGGITAESTVPAAGLIEKDRYGVMIGHWHHTNTASDVKWTLHVFYFI